MFWGLLDIAAGIILGNSMSVGLQNSISVSIALELSVVSNATLTVNTIQEDAAGKKQVVYDNSSNYLFARKLWLSTIHTLKHCEENYQSYTAADSALFNRKMLYYTKNSNINLLNNLMELQRMQNQYAI